VVDATGLTVVESIETGPGAHTLAFDTDRQELFVFLPSSSSVLAYSAGG
jgi:hypothetical protein